MADAVSFYWQWLKLAFGAVGKTRAIVGTLAIFGPGLTLALQTDLFGTLPQHSAARLQELPRILVWAPFAIFIGLFFARLALAPYWLYRDKPKPAAKISKEQAEALQNLWRAGSLLYEQRVKPEYELILWQHKVFEWTSDAMLRLNDIDPSEAFAFESIGFHHRQQQNLNDEAQYVATRSQLGDRLEKLRRITSRHLAASE